MESPPAEEQKKRQNVQQSVGSGDGVFVWAARRRPSRLALRTSPLRARLCAPASRTRSMPCLCAQRFATLPTKSTGARQASGHAWLAVTIVLTAQHLRRRQPSAVRASAV